MSSTSNPSSVLSRLRSVVPKRSLNHFEAQRVAELQANRLLLFSGVDRAGTPSEIVESLRFVQVRQRSDLPASGYTDWYKPHWLIMLNAHEPLVRQRFSLMHEFKHVLDHPFIDYLYPGSWSMDSERRGELAADYFAACVLMPKRFVKHLWGQGHQRVDDLATIFGVSEMAMAFRLQQLGLVDPRSRCDHAKRTRPPIHGYFRSSWLEPALAA